VPVALPAAFALAGALGAQRLAGRGILTARLTAIQDAATMDVLCADKTGTITQNRLAAGAVTARPGYTPAQVLGLAAEASDEATQDPIDLAVIAAARDRGAPRGRPRRDFVPFDPATKRSQATVAAGAGVAHVAKGAPQVIAALAGEPADPEVGRLAADGARVLAVAVSGCGGRWRQAGLIALADPPRPDAAALVTGLGALGVRVVMLTGDSLATAQAIAGQVGIFGPAIRAADVPEGGSELDFGAVAEVLPEDKHRIIRHLQQAGHTVGMTGDGVNDAPALRQAELGVAVAGATDVAKSAAGVVLTRPGLGGIAELVRESRRDHQRSLTYALNVAIKKIEIPFLLALGVFAWRQFIFTPLLMALMLLGNDVVSMTITTDRAGYAATPDTWDIRRFFTGALVLAVPLLALSAGVVWTAHAAWPAHSLPRLQTLVFLTLITSSQAALYLVRTRRPAWASRPGTWVIAGSLTDLAAAAALVLSGALMPAPLSPAVAAAVIGAVVAGVLLIDLIKVPVFGALGIHRT
jgi:H+-transporting ATPase